MNPTFVPLTAFKGEFAVIDFVVSELPTLTLWM
jgi:hypothetical protein